jgi:hypothetical protein
MKNQEQGTAAPEPVCSLILKVRQGKQKKEGNDGSTASRNKGFVDG